MDAPKTMGDWLGANGPAVPTDPNFASQVDFIASLGVGWCRLNTDLAWFTRPYLDTYLQAIGRVIAAGLIPLPVISGAVDGYRQSTNGLCTDAGLQLLHRKVRPGFERLFAAGVRTIETQNEWDGPGVMGKADVPRTVKTHRLLYELWHAVGDEPVMCVVGGTSTAGMTVGGVQLFGDVAYQQFFDREGGSASHDAVAHHFGAFYNWWEAPAATAPYNPWGQLTRIKALLPARERVWATEIPWPSDVLGDRLYERVFRDLFEARRRMVAGELGPTFVYHGCRDGAPGHDNTHKSGLLNVDGTEKKAACDVIRTFAQLPSSN